jgi:hypothetical protein
MERLPYIDEHVTEVDVNRAETWSTLVREWGGDARRPFFSVDEAIPPRRLALKGHHPFAVYMVVFELAEVGPQRTRVAARTWADFPGMSGKVYRALVIGTGGHRVAVHLMLKRIAAAARRASVAAP